MVEEIDVDLAALQEELTTEQALYEEASREESAARSETTAVLNRLNAVQKALDEAFAHLHENAPRASDWQRGQ